MAKFKVIPPGIKNDKFTVSIKERNYVAKHKKLKKYLLISSIIHLISITYIIAKLF